MLAQLVVWKTVRLGTGLKNADDFCKAIRGCGMKIGLYAVDMIGRRTFTVAPEEMELDLIAASAYELGFTDRPTRRQIYIRARDSGLYLCPVEVGPQLRLQYKDQPKGEKIVVATEPIIDSDGALRLFALEQQGSVMSLSRCCGQPNLTWPIDQRFIFSATDVPPIIQEKKLIQEWISSPIGNQS